MGKAKTTLRSKLKMLAAFTPEAAQRALMRTGADILAISQQLVPVDSGSLKKSGGVVPVDSITVHVGYGGPGVYYANREPSKYAVHVEYGTVRSPAQPYLRPAFWQSRETFLKRVKEEMENLG
jgi:HK97 gp10 family phage protein